ncbi:MAG: amino acid aldolase [Bacteroidia bacterium]|jgi:D-serine deaminase-like pyridoxal phosphate-dependent protein|nr:MAG: amino acid aldolase [Bacteroidia bacterium]
MSWEETYFRFTTALRDKPRPLALVDKQAFEENARRVLSYAGRLPVRIATKSLRCTPLLRHLIELDTRFNGFLCMSAREALYLARQGLDNFVIGYPFFQPAEQEAFRTLVKEGKNAVAMIDCVEHAEALHYAFRGSAHRARVCIEIDVSSDWGWLYFGVRRSPLHSEEALLTLAQALRRLDRIEVVGLMAYEAQIAGVGDKDIGWKSFLLPFLKRKSWKEVQERRQRAVESLHSVGFTLEFVNGGGTGSLLATSQDPTVTEVTAGSAFFAPALFDHYQEVTFVPAAGFSVEIVRRPTPNIFTCHGGGYIASGAAGPDKLPRPWLPPTMRFLPHEGAGEIQTPVFFDDPPPFLRIGEPLYFRHAKAGELSQRFPSLYLINGDRIEATLPTYASLPEVWA